MIDTNQTLGDLVTTTPDAARVFHRHGLDFCSGGRQSLAQACSSKGIDPVSVVSEIEAGEKTNDNSIRWDLRPLDELIDHILIRYHTPLKSELPRLVELARKVEKVHAGKPDCPAGLANLLAEIRISVDSHLAKEEQILFPLIRSGHGQMAYTPIHVMIQEHEDHGHNLERIRKGARDLYIPEYACASWRELYRALAQLEVELMEHIHLENNILFPRALAA